MRWDQTGSRRICTSMLSGKPASIAAIWAEPKLATRRAEEPKPERKRKSEEKKSATRRAEEPNPEKREKVRKKKRPRNSESEE